MGEEVVCEVPVPPTYGKLFHSAYITSIIKKYIYQKMKTIVGNVHGFELPNTIALKAKKSYKQSLEFM